MFEQLEVLPPDPILGLIGRFADDPHPDKVDLGVGVYRDESGRTPIMGAVREAERAEAESGSTKAYFGQAGNPVLNPVIQDLVLGPTHPATTAQRALTLQTPGGSGALRVAAELLAETDREARVWVPTPTWANHVPLISAAGVRLLSYPYYDLDAASVDRSAMFGTLESAHSGDIVLLHAACHNPTGADLEPDDWHGIAELLMRRGTAVLIDNAYQGFASGLEADAAGIRVLVEAGLEVLIATSFSKNFGLYRDRAGALTICGPSSRDVSAAFTNALRLVRTMYSMPPDHGPAVVGRILTSTPLRTRWETELEHMRTRLARLRHLLADALAPDNGSRFERVRFQQGMFSLLGVSEEAAAALIEEFHIYLPSNGRINVAGISAANVEAAARAITTVARR